MCVKKGGFNASSIIKGGIWFAKLSMRDYNLLYIDRIVDNY